MLVETERMKSHRMLAEALGIPYVNLSLVGSTLICGQGNDEDYLCLVNSEDVLSDAGFKPDLDVLEYESDFGSWRKGNINLIATSDRGFYLAEIAIAHAAKVANERKFSFEHRNDRIIFHGAVREAVSVHLTATV